jgi:threonine aldolase
MANLIAILSHTKPGDGIIVERSSHIMTNEAEATRGVAGVIPRPVDTANGAIGPEAIAAPATLLCLENTHNRHGGTCMTVEDTHAVADAAHAARLKVHLDGARIFNASAALGVDVRELAAPTDSIMFCLTKALCCPVGSLLCGSHDFIAVARRKRKMLGGAMHQAGLLAACGILAMESMTPRIHEDHANARLLAEGIAGRIPCRPISCSSVWTRA